MPVITEQDIEQYWAGDTLHIEATIWEPSDAQTEQDLTGADVEWTLRELLGKSPEFTRTLGDGIVGVDLATGRIRIEIDAGETSGLDGEYYQRCVVTAGSGEQSTAFTGWIDIEP